MYFKYKEMYASIRILSLSSSIPCLQNALVDFPSFHLILGLYLNLTEGKANVNSNSNSNSYFNLGTDSLEYHISYFEI